MKTDEEIMEILAAYDLTGSYRRAAELAGCDHHTVRRYVQLRGTGVDPSVRVERPKMIDEFMPKVEELVEQSKGKIGADVVHGKLVAMGFAGTDRSTRRAVAVARESYRAGNRRVHRPWVVEPGLWMQWDWGEGPRVQGRRSSLWCAWLAWCRFRVVIAVLDKTIPTIAACLDTTFRAFGGVPTYCLTDNEKAVTTDHVASIAVRNPDIVAIGRYYGTVVRTCLPADPASKGGSEATVRIAKRDLVPTEVNLRAAYTGFVELEEACAQLMAEVNGRVHRETRRVPGDMLAEERHRLHLVPAAPYTAVFGQTRTVNIKDCTVSVGSVRYSVPHTHAGEQVWVRFHGEELIVTGMMAGAPAELARHQRSTPGNPRIDDAHYPASSRGRRSPKPASAAEAEFLAIGAGATGWLMEAAAQGATRIRSKMAEAVTLAKLHGNERVDAALGSAALAGRFGEGDLMAILDYHSEHADEQANHAGETHSLQPGTAAWSQMGR